MSKRLTDQNKWKNEWFRTLPDRAKLFWIYILDECDNGGVWKADWGLAAFQLGFKADLQFLSAHFLGKVHILCSNKVLILDFYKFQFSTKSENWSAKKQAKKILESHGIIVENDNLILPKEQNIRSGTTTGAMWGDSVPTSLCNSKGNSKGKKGGVGENKKQNEPLEKIYALYPRKEGKSVGFKKLEKQIRTEQDLADFQKAVINYGTACFNKHPDYIKHFSSFCSPDVWKDWVDPKKDTNYKPYLDEIFKDQK